MHLASRVLRSGVSSGEAPDGDAILVSLDRFRKFILLFWYSSDFVLYFPLFPLKMVLCALHPTRMNQRMLGCLIRKKYFNFIIC